MRRLYALYLVAVALAAGLVIAQLPAGHAAPVAATTTTSVPRYEITVPSP